MDNKFNDIFNEFSNLYIIEAVKTKRKLKSRKSKGKKIQSSLSTSNSSHTNDTSKGNSHEHIKQQTTSSEDKPNLQSNITINDDTMQKIADKCVRWLTTKIDNRKLILRIIDSAIDPTKRINSKYENYIKMLKNGIKKLINNSLNQ